MGADFLYAAVPACKYTPERKIKLREYLFSLTDEDFYHFDACTSGNRNRESLSRLVDEYWTLCQRRDCGLFFANDIEYFITGGMSWGDVPTDIFDTITKFECLEKIYTLLTEWAEDDKGEHYPCPVCGNTHWVAEEDRPCSSPI